MYHSYDDGRTLREDILERIRLLCKEIAEGWKRIEEDGRDRAEATS